MGESEELSRIFICDVGEIDSGDMEAEGWRMGCGNVNVHSYLDIYTF